MNLFKKDYLKLDATELNLIKEFDSLNPDLMAIIKNNGDMVSVKDSYRKRMELMDKNPFILNHTSYFPNNYLNEPEIKLDKFEYLNKLQNFQTILNDEDITERDILNYIRDNEAYFLIGSVLKNYTSFGHHDRYLFKEFKLPPDYQADFLVVGKNSEGYHFLFFELENPYNNITLKNGSFGLTIRKGIEQINDWNIWLEKNFNTLKNVFNKQLKPKEKLPSEFLEFDSSRMNYVVVAGRRTDFNDRTYRLRREYKKRGVLILHYDNLIDESTDLIKTGAY